MKRKIRFFFIPLILICFYSCEKDNTTSEKKPSYVYVVDYGIYSKGIIKINTENGSQESLTNGIGYPSDICIDVDDTIFVSLFDPASIVNVEPDSGKANTISSGNLLKSSTDGICLDYDNNLLVAKGVVQFDKTPRIIKVDRNTGSQSVLSEAGLFYNVADVLVTSDGNIYAAGTGIYDNNGYKYTAGALFKIDRVTGEQTTVFINKDYNSIQRISEDVDGHIYAATMNALIRINPSNGNYNEILTPKDNIRYISVACSNSGDVYIIQRLLNSSGTVVSNSICKINLTDYSLIELTKNNLISWPTGLYVK